MELGSWSIIQAPSLLALIPLVVYIVLVFRGKNNVSGIIVGIFLAVLMAWPEFESGICRSCSQPWLQHSVDWYDHHGRRRSRRIDV